jgi:citronellol/citronellal dehydrogenase
MGRLNDRVAIITGAGQGIGLAYAERFLEEGAKVVVAEINEDRAASAMEQLEKLGDAIFVQTDISDEQSALACAGETKEQFGGIDILVNNASAISLTGTLATPMKRFDLMFGVDVRGTFLCSQACLPHLETSAAAGRNPHILTLSPPLNLDPRWFRDHVAYTIAKYGMSMCVLGMAEEFRAAGIAVNALWPRSVIATSAIAMIPGAAAAKNRMRKPEILADAAHAILTRDARATTGNFFIDDEVLAEAGVTDFSRYAVEPGNPLLPDIFL